MIQVENLIGKPYKQDGQGPDGFNCWNLCREVVGRFGRRLPEYDVPQSTDERTALAVRVKDSAFKRLKQPEPGCLAVFRIWNNKGKEHWHVGVVLDDCLRFIHVTEKTFVCITSLKNPLWNLFLEGYYSYAG